MEAKSFKTRDIQLAVFLRLNGIEATEVKMIEAQKAECEWIYTYTDRLGELLTAWLSQCDDALTIRKAILNYRHMRRNAWDMSRAETTSLEGGAK